jgi:hypothetical protein
MSITRKLAAIGASAVLAAGAGAISVAPAEAASTGTCTVSVHLWTNSDEEIISDATAVCKNAKAVSVRSRLYYCTWYKGSSRSYEVQDSKKVGPYKTFNGKKKVTVVEKAMYGRWYGEAYVWYTKGGVRYSKSDLQFGSVGGPSKETSC